MAESTFRTSGFKLASDGIAISISRVHS